MDTGVSAANAKPWERLVQQCMGIMHESKDDLSRDVIREKALNTFTFPLFLC